MANPMVVRDGLSEQIQSQVCDTGVKNMSMRVTLPKLDLLGIAMRAMMGIVHYSAWGVLSDVQLRGGGTASGQAINALMILVCANEVAVFVSCKSQMVHNQNMIAVS